MQNLNIPNAQQMLEILCPRRDAFATWKSGHPATERTSNKQDVELSMSHIEAHLRGDFLIGIYSTNRDDTCTWAAIDIDNFATATDDARAVMSALKNAGFEPLLERSKSGKGYHVWLLLASAVAAYKLRLVLLDIIKQSGIKTEGTLKSEKAFDRIYPNQDSVHGGYGNLLAVPFWGKTVPEGNSLFIDPETLTPSPDQLAVLLNAKRVLESEIDVYIDSHKLGKLVAVIQSRKSGKVPRAYKLDHLGELSDIHSCEFIKYVHEHRTDLHEQLWFSLANNLAPYGEDGRTLFHALSEGHEKYSIKEADQKFDNSLKRLDDNKSPVGCKKLEEHGFACPLLKECQAKVVANYTSVYMNVPMTLTEMQQYTHAVATANETTSRFRRFALGWQKLDENEKEEILNQVADSQSWSKQQDKNNFIKRLKSVRKKETTNIYVPHVRDYIKNAPGNEELVFPANYFVEKDKLYHSRLNSAGETEIVLIAEQVLILTETGHDHDRVEIATRTLAFQTATGDWETVQVSRAESSDGRTLHRALGNSSFNMSSDQGQDIVRYLRQFESANSTLLIPKMTTAHLGWVQIQDEWAFIPYSTAATLAPKGAGDKAMTRPETFAPKGNFNDWLELIRLVSDYPVATFLLVSALTPPLLPALGQAGQSHTVAICGDRGSGKTVMQQIGASAFGSHTALVRSWDATSNGMEQALALRKHMPAMYEDLQNATNEQVSKLVYMIFNGVGRERMAKNGGTRVTAEFDTVIIASAEADIRGKAQFQGFLRRSLVVTEAVFGSMDRNDIPDFAASLLKIAQANQGSFGREWVNRIGEVLVDGETSKQLAERLEELSKHLLDIAKNMNASDIDGTLARLMAHHFVTAELLQEWFGLSEITNKLIQVWEGIVLSAQEHDLNRMYMYQAIEWATREQQGKFQDALLSTERYGIITDDYIAFYRDALQKYLQDLNKNKNLDITPILSDWAKRDWIQVPNKKAGYTVDVRLGTKNHKMVKVLLDADNLPSVEEYVPIIQTDGKKAMIMRMPVQPNNTNSKEEQTKQTVYNK